MYIMMAIPFFFIMIGIEYVLSLIQRRELYRLNDSVNDLSMGIVDQVGGAFFATITFAGYLYIWDHWKLWDLGAASMWSASETPLWVWIACFVGVDFVYYWAHRMGHEMNIGWASHIAHHQSEEYNLSVALRQGVFQPFYFYLFYLPLAFVGFPPLVLLACSQLNTIYQFWIHTRAIDKLGPIEWIMNTPSHHRVHHGRDDKYIDRNHAGVFIVWDRMFGTFQQEEEEPNYGLVAPLHSWNPLWGQVHYYAKLGQQAWHAPRWQDKLQVWFREPDFVPQGLERPGPNDSEKWTLGIHRKYDTSTPFGLQAYVLLHFVLLTVMVLSFLGAEADMAWLQRAGTAAMVFATVLSFGGIFESRLWVRYLEPVRIIVLTASLLAWGTAAYGYPQFGGIAANVAAIGIAAVSLPWFLAYWNTFTVPSLGLPTPPSTDDSAPDAGMLHAK